jgi:hypothetical protein
MVARLRGRIPVLSLMALLFLVLAAQAEPSRVVQAEEILRKIELGQPVKYDRAIIVGDLKISKSKMKTTLTGHSFNFIGKGKRVISPIEITDSEILGNVNFVRAFLLNDVIFTGTKFKGYVYLQQANFNQTADFSNVQFDLTADFSKAQFNQEAQFMDANFLDLSFDNCLFSKDPFFDNAQINGTLSLYRTKYDKLNIRWSSIHDLAYDDTAYYQLIENFKKLGFTDDASECYYSYRCKHREELFRQGKIDSWFFDLLAWATNGYGLRPVRPLGWSVLFIFLGGVFFFVTKSISRSKGPEPSGNRRRAIRGKDSPPRAGEVSFWENLYHIFIGLFIYSPPQVNEVSIWEALLLSATYFTSGASAIISSVPEEFRPLGRSRYVVVILRLLGWVFFVLFLTSLGKIA